MDVSSETRQQSKSVKHLIEGKSRICSLPDPVLTHIISFLPTKQAVRTCVLSKRWEFLWMSVTNLEFEEEKEEVEDNAEDGEYYSYHNLLSNKRENFLNLVERVFLLHDSSNIHTFSLICDVQSDWSRIHSWVCAAVNHQVQKLIFRLCSADHRLEYLLPRSLFACESLKELELDLFHFLSLPCFVGLPNLKTLTLSRVVLKEDHSANQLFSSCPNLEKLALIECRWVNVKAVSISAPLLEQLEIVEAIETRSTASSCQFMISGASLKGFSYKGELKHEYCISDVPLLVDASIHHDSCVRDIHSYESQRQAAYRAHKLLDGLANARRLDVSSDTLYVLADAEELVACLPSFPSLNHLKLRNRQMDLACSALLKMLQNSPYLASIYFAAGICLSTFKERKDWILDPVPPCFLTHLKMVNIGSFHSSEEELYAVETLSKAATALEKVDMFQEGMGD